MNLSIYQKKLLNTLIKDEKQTNHKFYSAGPYWTIKTKKIVSQLNTKGINNFRGLYSGVGTSYSDNVPIDFRNEYDIGREKIYSFITKIYPFSRIYNEQIKFTENYFYKQLEFEKDKYKSSRKVIDLISNYKINNTVEFGCIQKFSTGNNEYSFYYLELLNIHDQLTKYIDFNKIYSLFEIGGGFGANIHILLQNYSNIKKVLYLDIVPNLLVGTEYLRYFYGDSIIDYNMTKDSNQLHFSNDDKLEILCIAPWQIENFLSPIDYFYNANSFVEMSKTAVENYSKHILRLLKNDGSLSLVSYFKPNFPKILNPKDFDKFFQSELKKFENPDLLGYRNYFFLVS